LDNENLNGFRICETLSPYVPVVRKSRLLCLLLDRGRLMMVLQ
jgi:hypothetical protein